MESGGAGLGAPDGAGGVDALSGDKVVAVHLEVVRVLLRGLRGARGGRPVPPWLTRRRSRSRPRSLAHSIALELALALSPSRVVERGPVFQDRHGKVRMRSSDVTSSPSTSPSEKLKP